MNTTLSDLLRSLGSENGMERKRAREIIVLIGEPAASEVRALLSSTNKKVRWEAAKTLAAMVDPSSTVALIGLLTAYESDLRWIAADGLINLGPRTAVPLLESLLEGPTVKGQAEMGARVLRQLAADNDVLAKIVSPVIEALKDPDPVILQPKVERALTDLSTTTGQLPPL